MLKIETKINGLNYWVSGENPRLIIHSGTHGDEYEVTKFVSKYVNKYEKILPPFIFVPEVSPTAISQKTRENGLGHDMNRSFFSDSTDPEIIANLEIIKNNQVELFVSFHEDPPIDEYYVYDIGYEEVENRIVQDHNQLLKRIGIKLLTGIDDIEDPGLGYEFRDGYNITVYPKDMPENGSISSWLFKRNITKEYLLPEIPGLADKKTKDIIVDTFFSEVILKMF